MLRECIPNAQRSLNMLQPGVKVSLTAYESYRHSSQHTTCTFQWPPIHPPRHQTLGPLGLDAVVGSRIGTVDQEWQRTPGGGRPRPLGVSRIYPRNRSWFAGLFCAGGSVRHRWIGQ